MWPPACGANAGVSRRSRRRISGILSCPSSDNLNAGNKGTTSGEAGLVSLGVSTLATCCPELGTPNRFRQNGGPAPPHPGNSSDVHTAQGSREHRASRSPPQSTPHFQAPLATSPRHRKPDAKRVTPCARRDRNRPTAEAGRAACPGPGRRQK